MSRVRVELLLQQMDYTWAEEAWFLHLAGALEGVGAAEAAWRPPGAGNTIWQTVNHCTFYNDRVLRKLTGRPLNQTANNTATFGEPGDPADAEGWAATLEHALRVHDELRGVLAELTDDDLDREPKLAENLPLLVIHDAYHVGQIVLTRKMQGSYPSQRDS